MLRISIQKIKFKVEIYVPICTRVFTRKKESNKNKFNLNYT